MFLFFALDWGYDSWLSFCFDLPKIINCNLELRAKQSLSSNVWGWGSGYVVIAIEIKLQKQLTFRYCLGYVPYLCVFVCTQNNLWTGFWGMNQVFRLGGRCFLPAESLSVSPSSVVPLCSQPCLASNSRPASASFARVVGMHHHARSSLIERVFKVVGQRPCLWVLCIRKEEIKWG